MKKELREPRLLHVSCIVREDGEVWALLRALEACSAGNVEVKPVGGDIPPHVAAHMGFQVSVEPEQEQIPPPPPSMNAVLRLPKPPQKKRQRTAPPRRDGETKRTILAMMQHLVPVHVGQIITKTGFSKSTVYAAMHDLNKTGVITRQSMGIYVRSSSNGAYAS